MLFYLQCTGSNKISSYLPSIPAGGFKLLINNDAKTTSSSKVTLSLTAGSNTKNMAISNFPDFKDAGQEPYQATKTWNICQGRTTCPSGQYTVYTKFYTQYGQPSQTVQTTITYNGTGTGTKTSTTTQTQTINQPVSQSTGAFTQSLRYGLKNNDVVLLQDTLKNLGFFPQSVKSSGKFGLITLKAVEDFQVQYNIAKPGDIGYGYVGPKTRQKLNQLNQ